MTFPQLIPSAFCLECRGCCVFDPQPEGEPCDGADQWLARLMVEEEIGLEKSERGISFGGKVKTVPSADGRVKCRFLSDKEHHCRVYSRRPLECAMYPFLLSLENGTLKLYVHLACPFVIERRLTPEFNRGIAQVRAWMAAPENAGTLRAVRAMQPDYSSAGAEVEFLADVSANDNAAELIALKPQLTDWFSRRKPLLSSRSFVSLFAWADFFEYRFEASGENYLVIARQHGGDFCSCPPLGAAIHPTAVTQAFARMQGGTARIDGVAEDELPAFDNDRYRAHEQGEEYYYERARIAALSGNSYRSQRTEINGLLRRSSPIFRPYVSEDARGCHDLFDRWLDKRSASQEDDIYRAMLVENRVVHRRLIDHAGYLGLTGRVVELAGRVVAYTFGYPLNDETFCVALEITDPEIKGLPAYIFRECCADPAVKPFKFINAMDDFGMPGVAKAKRSWRPAFMQKVYSICLKP